MSVILYGIVALAFQQEFGVLAFCFTVFMGHAPEGDMIPYLLWKKYKGSFAVGKNKANGHWVFGHHPLPIIPLGVLCAYIIAPEGAE
ncbi:MAG: hypothetical protein LR017_00860 [Candidatus Pacebacteria bacterium]|nr:hypothetical protein [Candidatus Paceibacterota bacterium]